MQITNSFSSGAFPPSSGGNALDIASQLRRQRREHRRILLRRAVRKWWYPILLVILGGLVGTVLGPITLLLPKVVVGILVALPLLFMAVRRVEFGLLLAAIATTAFTPRLISIKSLDITAITIMLLLLSAVLIVQVAFHMRKLVLPSFWVIWPQIGLLVMAFVSSIMVQLTWTRGVPHRINSNPIIYDEILGVALFFIPVITVMVTTMIVATKERLIESIQNAFIVLALLAAVVVIIDFKRIGADVYTFRFAEPMIAWMSLRALAQLLGLGAILCYGRALYATRARRRFLYLGIMVLCLIGVYLTLENSWWLEVGIALIVMTLVYSRRLFIACCLAVIPFIPLLKAELAKLSAAKVADYTRIYVWQDSLRVWSKQPIFGVGPGNFWAYDQVFTGLPKTLRNCDATGLCVSHNGFLQTLGELGPIGLFFYLAFIVVICIAAFRLFRRSPIREKEYKGLLRLLDIRMAYESVNRKDRILGLAAFGLVIGSVFGDLFSGSFFLQPRQVASLGTIPQVLTSWMIWGMVMYKDQIWRIARRKQQLET